MNLQRLSILSGCVTMLWFCLTACDTKPQEPQTEDQSENTSNNAPPKNAQLNFSQTTLYKKVSAEVSEVEFIFEATNTSNQPIQITKLDSGCECIAEKAVPTLIQPGQSSKISALYETKTANGLVEKIMTVHTDQSGPAAITYLKIKLEVQPLYSITPSSVAWKMGEKNNSKTVDFKVHRDKPIHILSHQSSRKDLEFNLEELIKGRHYQIEITPKSTERNLLGLIRLTTDCEIPERASPLIYISINR